MQGASKMFPIIFLHSSMLEPGASDLLAQVGQIYGHLVFHQGHVILAHGKALINQSICSRQPNQYHRWWGDTSDCNALNGVFRNWLKGQVDLTISLDYCP